MLTENGAFELSLILLRWRVNSALLSQSPSAAVPGQLGKIALTNPLRS
jgi:hypothetical protein